jgi:hypothetical protein
MPIEMDGTFARTWMTCQGFNVVIEGWIHLPRVETVG